MTDFESQQRQKIARMDYDKEPKTRTERKKRRDDIPYSAKHVRAQEAIQEKGKGTKTKGQGKEGKH